MADRYGVQVRLGVSSLPAISSSTTALAANPDRVAFIIQNLGTNALFVRYSNSSESADAASTTVFNVVLKASTGADDGSGGSLSMEGTSMWAGLITVAGTAPRYTATELTA